MNIEKSKIPHLGKFITQLLVVELFQVFQQPNCYPVRRSVLHGIA